MIKSPSVAAFTIPSLSRSSLVIRAVAANNAIEVFQPPGSANGYTFAQLPLVQLSEVDALSGLIAWTLTVATVSKLLNVTVYVEVEPISALPKSMEAGVAMSTCATEPWLSNAAHIATPNASTSFVNADILILT